MQNLQEKRLLYKIQTAKDADAFASLYDTYVERIYRFIYLKVRTREEAEDLTADTFLKAWQYLTQHTDEPRQIRSFSGLLHQVARNVVVDLYRRKASHPEQDLETVPDLVSNEDGHRHVEMQSEFDTLLGHLDRMKQEYRDIILLRHMEELSISEIADILGKSKTNVRVTLHRALGVLKKLTDGNEE